jgi:holo-[acyl-carrier protein] synthase
MIIGLGNDVVNIERIEKVLARFGSRFIKRIFTASEIEQFNGLPKVKQVAFIAKRFAAKEAAVKALGTGFSHGISWQDIEVVGGGIYRPSLKFAGKALEKLDDIANGQDINIMLSLSDDYPIAMAVVTISYAITHLK